MRILTVPEINRRALYWAIRLSPVPGNFLGENHSPVHAVPPPPPPPLQVKDPTIGGILSPDEMDEEVRAIMACSPVNFIPLIKYEQIASPPPEILNLPFEEEEEGKQEEVVDDDDDDDNGKGDKDKQEDEEVSRAWEAREGEEIAARAMARQAETQAEEEDVRVQLLREAEEEIEEEAEEEEEEMEEEDQDDEEQEVISEASQDSGLDSTTDSEPMDQDEGSSSSNNSSDNEDDAYDPVRDPEREARLHRLLGIKKNLWQVRQRLLRLKRTASLRKIERKLRRVRERRTHHMRNLTRAQRRRLPAPEIERPRRNRDFCYGCGRFYLVQRIRWWWRCEMCGFWLCPDCSTDPLHCQRNEII